MSAHIRINDVSFYRHEDDGGLHWDGNADLTCPGGGSDAGRILVALDVDGNLTCVYGDLGPTNDLQAIEKSIEALTAVREQLAALYGAQGQLRGRCMAQGDWGRCGALDEHAGPHDFPKPAIAS